MSVSGGAPPVEIHYEGAVQGPVRVLNFTGSPIACAVLDGVATITVGSGGALTSVFVQKSANQSVVNSAVLVNDADLVLAIGANEAWCVRFWLLYDAHATPDIKFGLTVPAGAVGRWSITPGAEHAFTETQMLAGAGLGVGQSAHLEAVVETGATAGLVRLQFAQNAANTNASTVRAYSHLLATKVT